MTEYHKKNVHLYCTDNMKLMAKYPDNYFDLAIPDPEYGINASEMQMGKGKKKKYKKGKGWDKKPPPPEYFNELFRVSKNQLIFGGNYFDLGKTGGWIIWDKDRQKDVSFADGEMIWTSFLNTMKIVKHKYDGFLGADNLRIHITQKPEKLYDKIFHKFTDKKMKLLDTHGGSFSSAISAYHFDFAEFVGCEIDPEYFTDAVNRFEMETAQLRMF